MFVLESIPADFSRCSKCEGGCFRKLIPLSGPILALEQVIMQSKFLFQCGGGGGKSEEPLNPAETFSETCAILIGTHTITITSNERMQFTFQKYLAQYEIPPI